MPSFARLQKVTRSKKKQPQETNDPKWEDVEKSLRTLGEGPGARLQLADSEEERVLTIYAEGKAFHLGIAIGGVEFHFYTTGEADKDDALEEIAWSQVPKEQVCKDLDTALAIARRFFETGERLESVRWISERF